MTAPSEAITVGVDLGGTKVLTARSSTQENLGLEAVDLGTKGPDPVDPPTTRRPWAGRSRGKVIGKELARELAQPYRVARFTSRERHHRRLHKIRSKARYGATTK